MNRIIFLGFLLASSLLASTSFAEEYDDSAINAATAATQSEAGRVRNAAASARRQASTLEQTAAAVRNLASEARVQTAAMQSQVGQVKANADATRAAEGRSRLAEITAQNKDNANLIEIESLKKEFEPLVQETYNVEQQQKFVDEALKDLDFFTNFLAKYYAGHDQLPAYIADALQLEKQADVAHEKWMSDLAGLIEEKKPDFDAIHDFTTMSDQVQKIVSFENSIPGMNELLKIEVRTKTSLSIARDRLNALKTDNFNLVAMRGFHITLHGTDFKGRLQEFYAIEKNLTDSLRQINALRSLIDRKNERRNYLIRMIPIVWNRIANLRLQAANITEGAGIINDIDASLRGPQMLSTIRSRTALFKSEIDNQLRYNFAPYAAYQAILGAQVNFQNIEKDLKEVALTSNLQVEINALLKDENAAVESRNAEVSLILTGKDFSKYLNEWKRQARLLGSRNQSKFTAACRDLLSDVLAISDFNKGSEQIFLTFKGACS